MHGTPDGVSPQVHATAVPSSTRAAHTSASVAEHCAASPAERLYSQCPAEVHFSVGFRMSIAPHKVESAVEG